MCFFKKKNKKVDVPVAPVDNPVKTVEVKQSKALKCYYGVYVPNSVETNNIIIINDKAIMSGCGVIEDDKLQVGILNNKIVYDEGNLFGPIVAAQKVVQTSDFYNSLENVFNIVGNHLKSYSTLKKEKREEDDLDYVSTLLMCQLADKNYAAASGNVNFFTFDGYDLINDIYLEKAIDYLLGENNQYCHHELSLNSNDIIVMTSNDFDMQSVIINALREKNDLESTSNKIFKNLKRTTKGITPFSYVIIKREV